MKLPRRSFLKLTSGLIAAAIADPVVERAASAPLFIPADRLEMGVPRAIVMPEPFTIYLPSGEWSSNYFQHTIHGTPHLIPCFARGEEVTTERVNEIVAHLRGVGGNVPPRFMELVRPGDPIDFGALSELQHEVAKANTQTVNRLLGSAFDGRIPRSV